MNMKTDAPENDEDDTEVVNTLPEGQANPLELSDEEFLKQGAPALNQGATSPEKTTEGGDDDENGDGEPADPKNTGAEPGEGPGASQGPKAGEGKEDKTPKTEGEPAKKDADPVDPKAKDAKADKTEGKPEKTDANKDAPLDATAKAAAYDRLMAPFKANGRDIQARNVEDAISLMQMGANYNKKMAGLKPVMKIAKLLENNGLLDEEKLGFLIDLHAKKPEAINKLVKESGISPMDIDPDKAGEYRPSAQKVDDRELDLDAVLDDIKESTAYTKTLSVAQSWDADSKKVIGDQPGVLKLINSHIESGVYDLISTEVERERTFGRLQGLSDIAAYKQVGDAIQARGGFDHLFQPSATAQAGQGKSSEAGKVVEPKSTKAEDESRDSKRRALGTPKPAAPSGSTAKDFNPLALSDDEFLKQATPKFR